MISQILLTAEPITTLFEFKEGARFSPVIVKSYPPPIEPELIDRLLTMILYSNAEVAEGTEDPAVETTTNTL